MYYIFKASLQLVSSSRAETKLTFANLWNSQSCTSWQKVEEQELASTHTNKHILVGFESQEVRYTAGFETTVERSIVCSLWCLLGYWLYDFFPVIYETRSWKDGIFIIHHIVAFLLFFPVYVSILWMHVFFLENQCCFAHLRSSLIRLKL